MHDPSKGLILFIDDQAGSPAWSILRNSGFEVIPSSDGADHWGTADAVVVAVHAGQEGWAAELARSLQAAHRFPVLFLVDEPAEPVVEQLAGVPLGGIISTQSSPAFWTASILNAIHLVKARDAAVQKYESDQSRKETLLRAIYEQSPIGIELYDAGGWLQEQNPVCRDIFGIDDPASERRFCLFDDPNIPESYKFALRRGESFQLRSRFNFEQVGALYHYRSARNGIIWLDRFFSSLKDAHGQISGYMVHVQDISERKRMEEQLRRESRRYELLMQTSRDAIHVVDQNGKLVEWNAAFLEHLRITAQEASTLSVFDWDARWSRDEVLGLVRLNLEQPSVIETIHRRKDGSLVDVEITAANFELNGEAFLFNSARDITSRKQAEQELRESEARFRSLFDQTQDAVFLLDLKGRNVMINPRAAEMLGYTMEEAARLSVYDVSSEIDQSLEVMDRLLAGEKIPVYERRFRKKSGEIFPVEVSLSLARDENQNPMYIVSIARDISHRKRPDEPVV